MKKEYKVTHPDGKILITVYHDRASRQYMVGPEDVSRIEVDGNDMYVTNMEGLTLMTDDDPVMYEAHGWISPVK